MIHEVMKLVVRMKLCTNGNKQVDQKRLFNMPGIIGNFIIIKQLF